MEHGQRSTYSYWKCRCDECKQANAEYMSALRARKALGQPLKYNHGTVANYEQGCRCWWCEKVARLMRGDMEDDD
jgi:hypothetical protein